MRPRAIVRRAAGLSIALALSLAASPASATAPHPGGDSTPPGVPPGVPPSRSPVALTDGRLRATVRSMEQGRSPGAGVATRGERVLVEVLYVGDRAHALGAVADAGGRVVGEAGTSLIEAYIPYGQLVALEHRPEITTVRVPIEANAPLSMQPIDGDPAATEALVTGQEIVKTNAAAWQAAGFTGSGVKVGIVDFFDQTAWNAAKSAGEVPAPSGTFCRVNGSLCDLWTGGSTHGEGVAEVVHEMAPGAKIYLATAISTADLQAAVNYFAANGVSVISRSLTAQYDGPGDGTGPIDQVVNSAIAQGMAWFNAAGNSAGDSGVYLGSYWRGPWSDPDADGWLSWSGLDEVMTLPCVGGVRFITGLRWSDWGANRTDYDLYLYDDATATHLLSSGTNDQTAGAPPIEYVSGGCTDTDYLKVHLADAGGGTAYDTLEFEVNGTGLEHWSNPHSAAIPAADSASAGALAIGAIDPATGTLIAGYSSHGPTNDDRIKPDISAASCVSSYTFAPQCFNGTSAAAPAAAGAAALVRGAGLAATPAALKSWLLTNAFVDRGAAGVDNIYGVGELRLPAPPNPDTPPTISDIPDQSTAQATAKGPIGFTVGDAESSAGALIVSGTSSNQALVPNSSIVFGGSGGSRTVTVTPAAGQAGSATITVKVSDGALTASETFVLDVSANGCVDDSREPDDLPSQASSLTSGEPAVMGVACDDDYFALDVVGGESIDAQLSFTNANGNLDLRLYSAAGVLLDASEGGADTERVTAGPLAAGTYLLRVYPRQGVANANDYTLAAIADDITAPHWTTRSPGSGATSVARDAAVVIAFSEALDPATITGASVKLRDTTKEAWVAASVGYQGATRTVTLRPSSKLAAGHRFKARGTTGIRDVAGNPFAGIDWVFTASTDTTRPKVSGRTPGSGDTGVARSVNVRVTFSEALRGSTVTASSVRLQDTTDGTIRAATIAWDGGARRVTLDPETKLAAHRTYRVLLSSSIRDKAGNRLRSTSWTFRTGG